MSRRAMRAPGRAAARSAELVLPKDLQALLHTGAGREVPRPAAPGTEPPARPEPLRRH